MNSKQKQICRLCLKVAKNGFRDIDNNMKQLFDILLLKLDLDVTRDPIICQDCVEVAKKCLNFKLKCIDTEQFILSFSAGMGKSKYSIKLLYAEKEHLVIANEEALDICRFCMSQLMRNNFVLLNTLQNETVFEMITKHMPEMDFNIPEDTIICMICRENLEVYSVLILNCLDTETKIKAYRKKDKSDNKRVINLDGLVHFLFKNIVEYSVEYQTDKIKHQSNRTEDTDGIHPEAYMGSIKHEELHIKNEEINVNEDSYKNSPEMILNKYNDIFPSKLYESDVVSLKRRKQNIEEYTCQQKIQGNLMEDVIMETSILGDDLEGKGNESSDMQINYHLANNLNTEQRQFIERNLITTNGALELGISNYAEAASESKIGNHMLVDNDVTMYKCVLCAYKTNRKNYLKSHMFEHKGFSEIGMFKCSFCAYTAKRGDCLKTHMLIHKDVSETKLFKCAFCAYESKKESYLKLHMLVHKDVSEIKMFKCPLCAYEVKRKSYLTEHMLVHKDVSEIEMFKCPLCAYETKRKSYLKTHMLVHRDISEIKTFKCPLCAYEAKRKICLTEHMLVHKDVSEIKMFKCPLCAYEAKRKSQVTEHMLVHKDVSEIKMFKCPSCAYEAKRKSCITEHMLVHKDVSEIKIFKCPLCPYEAKRKRYLKTHIMLVHKDVSEIKTFKCPLCDYEAKRKNHLTAHIKLVHKDVSEMKKFKCASCAYETNNKGHLTPHTLVHKGVSEIEMFKCLLCAFQTKRKGALNKHMLVHTKTFP